MSYTCKDNLGIVRLSYNPGKLPNTIQVGLLQKVFNMASFYRTLTAPAQEPLRTTVRCAIIYPKLSLAIGWCESLFRVKTPTYHHSFLREAVTVGDTSHILEKHKLYAIVLYAARNCRHRLAVCLKNLIPLLRCRSHTLRLKDNIMLGMAVQA